MKQRCYDKGQKFYKNYGGRGITVCKEWRYEFLPFFNWAKQAGYKKGLQMDRINNDGNYEPGNCRFVTREINMNNRRDNIFVNVWGEKMTFMQASTFLGIKYHKMYNHIRSGKTPQETINIFISKS